MRNVILCFSQVCHQNKKCFRHNFQSKDGDILSSQTHLYLNTKLLMRLTEYNYYMI